MSEQVVFEDFHEYLVNVTLDIICESILGVKSTARQDLESHSYAKSLQRFTEILVLKMFSPWLWFEPIFKMTQLGREMKEVQRVMNEYIRSLVQERKAVLQLQEKTGEDQPFVESNRLVFMDLLLKCHINGELSEEEVLEEVNTIAFAGHDTVGISTAFTLFLLGHHPEIQEKAAQEIDSVVGQDHEVTNEHVNDLKYLEAVIKESLRLYPPGPTFGRRINQEVTINNYTIPAFTDVWFNTKALHMDPKIYPNPTKFDPERFIGDQQNSIPAGAFAPFSLGPRNCIGNRFAMIEEKILLSHVLRKFTVKSLVPADELTLNFEIILRCRTPMRMKFIPRRSDSPSIVDDCEAQSPLNFHNLQGRQV